MFCNASVPMRGAVGAEAFAGEALVAAASNASRSPCEAMPDAVNCSWL